MKVVAYNDLGRVTIQKDGKSVVLLRPDGTFLRPDDVKEGQKVVIDEQNRICALGNRHERRATMKLRRN